MLGFRELDQVLRGESSAVAGQEGKLPVSVKSLVGVGILLAAGYGFCMAVYSLVARPEPEYRQVVASAIKVPALLILTLVVTFPSLYVFNTLLGSRLRIGELARLLAAAMGVLIAVLAAFGPIVAFFSVTTISYAFILVLNVIVFAVAGAFGIGYLQRTLSTLLRLDAQRRAEESLAADPEEDGLRKVPTEGASTQSVFAVWMLVFALVGSQMSWILRPFIGAPWKPFTWFRPRESSFLEAVFRSIRQLGVEG